MYGSVTPKTSTACGVLPPFGASYRVMPAVKPAVLAIMLAGIGVAIPAAQTAKVWTPDELFRRNIGTREDQDTAFPPHKIIGNLYYVGTRSLASFLVTTPQGHILINSDYERNVPTVRGSIEQLGFKYADVKIVLGSHAHADHMEGDALVKQLTGATVMAMAEDVPALEKMMPGGKPHPIDKVLHDGDEVKLGGDDARRAPDARPHARLHDVDVQGAGGREELRRPDHRQRGREPGHEAREQSGRAPDRRGVQPRPSRRCGNSTRTCRSARIPGCTTWPRSTRRWARGRTRTSTRRATRRSWTSSKACSGRSSRNSRSNRSVRL